jgi:hypothetical protein
VGLLNCGRSDSSSIRLQACFLAARLGSEDDILIAYQENASLNPMDRRVLAVS